MIIQCDHCNAKFRMDDAKLANGPVKVRCAKCKEVFVVGSESSPAEVAPASPVAVPPSSAASSTDFTADSFGESNAFNFDQEPSAESPVSGMQTPAADEFDWKDTSVKLDEPAFPSGFEDSSFDGGDVSTKAFSLPDVAADADNEFDFGDISLQPSLAGQTAQPPEPQDDFSIDFGEVSFETPATSAPAVAVPSTDAAADFSFEVAPTASATSASADSDDFLLSFNADQIDTPQPPVPPTEETESVNFGDFSFGEMADEVKEAPAVAVERPPVPEMEVVPSSFPQTADEELVPTSLTSRKKDGSRFPLFLILGAIVIIVALAGAGVYFFGGPKAFSKVGLGFLVDWYAEKRPEEGNVAIRNIVSSYVVNSNSGELFVVKGEAVNNFNKPRASVQVKVSILGPGGTQLVSKSAFCGNALSNEQLATLPLAKIEEAMNNQFGDSLANLGVKPGSAIPFVVVISAVPKEATDYSVQIAGSTVATQ